MYIYSNNNYSKNSLLYTDLPIGIMSFFQCPVLTSFRNETYFLRSNFWQEIERVSKNDLMVVQKSIKKITNFEEIASIEFDNIKYKKLIQRSER